MCWPPAPRGAEGVDAQVGGVELDFAHFVRFGQDGDGAGRGVHASLRFGGGHALHAMRAGFEFQHGIRALADDSGDDFLVAAHFAGAFRYHLDLPALALGEARVHAEQVARKQGCLVAAGAGAHFEEHVALVVGIFGQQLFRSSLSSCASRSSPCLISASANSFISGSPAISLRGGDVGLAGLPGVVQLYHRFELGALAVELAERVHVARGFLGA